MQRKNSFVLVEVLIALTLVISAITILLKSPISYFLAEVRTLQDIEMQQIADKTFYAIKEDLYHNAISWDKLAAENQKTAPKYSLSDDLISIKHLGNLSIGRSYQLVKKSKDQQGKDGNTYRLIYVYVLLSPKNPLFRLKDKNNKSVKHRSYAYRVIACKKSA